MKRFFLFILINVALSVSYAQERHPFINSHCDNFTTDIHGNVYLWSDATVNKHDDKGNFLCQYSNPSLGEITNIDASYPSKTMVFYQNACIIKLLDNKLAPIGNQINLLEHHLSTISLAAMISTHEIALYDNSNQDLYIIDLNANVLNITHCSFNEEFSPSKMLSYNEESIMMLDTVQGIYTFDKLGTFKNRINLRGITSFMKIGPEIIYLKQGRIAYYNQAHLYNKESGICHPEIKDFRIHRKGYLLLEKDGKIYNLDFNEE